MNIDTKEVQKKAIGLLTDGKTQFNAARSKVELVEGYDRFYEGIVLQNKLKTYEKDNQYAVKILSEKIKEYIAEAQKMKIHIENAHFKDTKTASNMGGNKGGNNNKGSSGVGGDDKHKEEKNEFTSKLAEAIVCEKPDISWDDVAGLENAKNTLKESILLPRKFPEIFQGIRTPWKGILLYGPPGTGKTFLAKACATMADATFFSISAYDLVSKWVGESEKLIKALFEQARERAPSIIFIDEIDSVVSKRSDGEAESTRRVKTEFLVQMEGVSKEKPGSLLVLGATNFPWGLDPAMRRRFEKRVYIPLPDFEAILYKLKRDLSKVDNNLNEQECNEIAEKLDGYSMSDISIYVRQACMAPLYKTRTATHFKPIQKNGRQCWQACGMKDQGAQKIDLDNVSGEDIFPPPIDFMDMIKALSKAKKSVSPEDLKKQIEFTRDFGMEG